MKESDLCSLPYPVNLIISINTFSYYNSLFFSDAPVCSTSPNSRLIGASQDESLRIRCDVTSDPLPEDFVWQFNNSGESLDVSSRAARTPPGGTRSILSYKPAGERDFGTLSCWGRNAIGKQTEPCVFQVVPAGKI